MNWWKIAQLNANPTPFYSHLERVLEQKMPNRASAQQVIGLLNGSGIKLDEIQWSGVMQYIQDHGTMPIDKRDILDHVRTHTIQIQKVWRGIGSSEAGDEARANLMNFLHKADTKYGGRPSSWPEDVQAEYSRLQKRYDDIVRGVNPNISKFDNWQIPGGENYKELLLTLPAEPDIEGVTKEDIAQKLFGIPYRDLTDEQRFEVTPVYQEAMRNHTVGRRNPQNYKSQHWEEPNVLAHVRMNDRTNEQNERVLHLEEIQSDWHQAGRKHGYVESDTPEMTALRQELAEAEQQVHDIAEQTEQEKLAMQPWTKDWCQQAGISSFKSTIAMPPELKARAQAAYYAAQQADPRHQALLKKLAVLDANFEEHNSRVTELREFFHQQQLHKVPDAPFKKNWHELALKHAIQHAAENGYDRLSWTPGQDQTDRYDLNRQISSLEALRNADDTYSIIATDHDGYNHHVGGNTSGNIPADQLEDHVGKDLAQKIINQPDGEQTYKDVDLKLNNDGMKGFYDQIVPNFLNGYGKKWGSGVSQTNILISPDYMRGLVYNGERHTDGSYLVRDSVGKVQGAYPTEAEAKQATHSCKQVPSIPITPQMRQDILTNGQRLSSIGERAIRL